MAAALVDSQSPLTPIRIVAPGKQWGVEPVELLVQRGVQKVPPKYRRVSVEEELQGLTIFSEAEKDEEKVASADSSLHIPIIDLKGWDESYREEVILQIREACEEWGFFRLINHGVDLALMEKMMQAAKDFIALPVEEKAAYVGQPGMISQGYGSKYTVGTDDSVRDWRDFLFLFLQPPSVRDYAYWPSKPTSFRETMEEYSKQTKELALKVLGVISEGLGERRGLLEEALQEMHQKMLINYYPACPQPDLVHGFHEHSDIGALTLVMQEDEAPVGLQVRHGNQWIPAHSLKGSFVVNVADQVEIWTNGRYKSIEHRVVPSYYKSRISIPVFCDAAPNTMISPLKELAKKAIYKEIKFDDHEYSFYEYGANGKSVVRSYVMPNISDVQHQPLSVS